MNNSENDEKFSGRDDDLEHKRYAPRRVREQGVEQPQPFIDSAPMVPTPSRVHQDWTPRPEFNSNPQRVPEPPVRLDDESSGLIGRIALVVSFAAVVALLLIFAVPLSQLVSGLFERALPSKADRAARTNVVASQPAPTVDRPHVPAGAVAVAGAGNPVVINTQPQQPAPQQVPQLPVAQPPSQTVGQTQQATLSNPAQPLASEAAPKHVFRGVTETEIRFGISAPFSGAAKELGQHMRLGLEAAFNSVNAAGGVFGRRLKLVAADDGYETSRVATTMKQLYEKEQVFAVIGNVGTPTAVVSLPYALERKMLFFGAFTGAGLLRNDPPDRYVFNYRASYAEETSATVHYLVKVRHLRPNQIAVFAQQDAYGDSGFAGVAKAIRALGGDDNAILRLHYQRNTVDVDDAVEQLKKSRIPIRAVIMVPTYRAAAKFIEKTRDAYPNMIYTSVSFVGSTALANELMLLGKRFATGVIVTQVVPAVEGHSSLVLEYKSALAKYFPGEPPDYVSLEGYVVGKLMIEALKRNGPQVDTERLVATLEGIRNIDLGLGTPVSFGQSEHQGVHKVWGTQLDENGRYQPIDLQ
ncbi:MAG TPA: ABC transporter substrate-binding protein [Pseudolabrys sp.]|jgi:ABC-type branched-subunit amino acid transport system substrate-binding protein